MNWVFLAGGAGLASSAFNLFNRYTLRGGRDSTAYGWWFEFIRLIFFGLILPLDFHLNWSSRTSLILSTLGLVEFFSVYLCMKMHAFTDLSLSMVLLKLRVVWVPLLALLLTQERLTPAEYLGIIIIFIGSGITISPQRIKTDKGIPITLAFSLVTALLNVVIKKSVLLASTPVVMIAMALPSIFLLPLGMRNPLPRIKDAVRKTLVNNMVASAFNILAMYLLLGAYRLSPAGKVMGVYQGMLVVPVLGGIIVLKERQDVLCRLGGALVTIIGILLVTALR
jgi:drug/metabolite transporter (DMT)-like permease